MNGNKIFKCPFCKSKYIKKELLYNHILKEHTELIPQGMSVQQFYFNTVNHKSSGQCVICKKETKWNDAVCRYDRLCSEKCKEVYKKQFRERMMKTYGKTHLLNDPDQQKKMLENRKISGKYKWSDGTIFTYTGTYEHEFLEFMDIFMQWSSKDIISPAPQVFKYEYEGKEHFYIPDVYIPSLNLIIEIKSSDNKHYRARDIAIETVKDKLLEKSNFNYFKVFDKKYDDFYNFILKIVNNI